MSLSFTSPKKKSILEQNTKMWVLSTMGAIAIMVIFNIVLIMKGSDMSAKREQYTKDREESIKSIIDLDAQLAEMMAKKSFGEDVYTQNTLLGESISNLFSLIPDQITLYSVDIQKKMLILKGVTPSKDVYSYLLSVPLKSVFTESEVDFYQTNDTWYNFVSVNRLKDDGEKVE